MNTLSSLERESLERYRRGDMLPRPRAADDDEGWLRSGISALLDAGRVVRGMEFVPLSEAVQFKADMTPVTAQETVNEAMVRRRLAGAEPTGRSRHGGFVLGRGSRRSWHGPVSRRFPCLGAA